MNLLLISIDSLRLDFVSRTNAQIRTPRFDRLSRGFRFVERCFSPSTATRPVHTSIFTGLYPFEHGVLGQGYARMRSCPHLFDLFERAGYQVAAFSEAQEIFAGLEYAPWIKPYHGPSIDRFMQADTPGKCLFLHYWSAHTPYGAADGKALGETAHLLRSGARDLVIGRYCRAVQALFDEKIARVLGQIDLEQWCVVLFSDHGEAWTADELYHGQTLRNAVLRVPLYLHVPGTGNPPLARSLVSLIDLFPTLVRQFNLPIEYRGLAGELYQREGPSYYLAQIHPLPSQDDSIDQALLGPPSQGPKWALFDLRHKFTYDEASGHSWLEDTLSEKPIQSPAAAGLYQAEYENLRAQSAYAGQAPPVAKDPGAEALLNQRLRDLGYLE